MKIYVDIDEEDHWKRDPIPPAKVYINGHRYIIQAASDFDLQAAIRMIAMVHAYGDDLYLPPKDWDAMEQWGYEIPYQKWLQQRSEAWFWGKNGAFAKTAKKMNSFAGMKKGFLL